MEKHRIFLQLINSKTLIQFQVLQKCKKKNMASKKREMNSLHLSF